MATPWEYEEYYLWIISSRCNLQGWSPAQFASLLQVWVHRKFCSFNMAIPGWLQGPATDILDILMGIYSHLFFSITCFYLEIKHFPWTSQCARLISGLFHTRQFFVVNIPKGRKITSVLSTLSWDDFYFWVKVGSCTNGNICKRINPSR